MQAGNLNAEDDFENDYLRYGGAVGVRNPRLVINTFVENIFHRLCNDNTGE